MKSYIVIGAFLLLVIALPLMLRRQEEKLPATDRQLVVISPHNEAIRHEIEVAFREYHKARTGEDVSIDWRTIGGASEIVRYINSTYSANFQHFWKSQGGEWNDTIAAAAFDSRTALSGDGEEAKARNAFLKSEVGIDIDVLMGGGQYDCSRLAQAGILVPSGVKARHPEWFSGERPALAAGGGGEIWYDSADCYYATCFSCFGIIYNRERLAAAGFSRQEIEDFGSSWRDLADPRLLGAIGIADPTQSGSITKCFEMLIQREMQDSVLDQCGGVIPENCPPEVLDRAWQQAMTLIKKLGGNAAYLTFSATKVTEDAAAGQIAAGMCIDFYGRSQVEWEKAHLGRETISYRTPKAGSSVSADPIGILRGAPNRKLAEEFVDFTLSLESQRLWANYAGTPGGPKRYTLYRQPVRRELYDRPAERAKMCLDPNEDPFLMAESFRCQYAWTGRLFNIIRILVKVMVIDAGPELRESYAAIVRHGGLESLDDSEQEAFCALPFQHHEASSVLQATSPQEQQVIRREWLEFFQEHYAKATPRGI